jgi:nucleoside-diphosphate-sugar epimerase
VQLMRRQPADVLVTGAGGFLGSALVQRLVGQGAKVRAGVRRMPKIVLAGVDYVVGDLGDAEYVDMLTADVDTVFHVGAAMKGSAVDFTRGTITGTQNMIAGCLRHEVRRAVHVSSLSVLDHAGRRDGAVNEASPLEPHAERRGAYTQTKLEAERLVMNAAKEQGLPAVVIRPGVIFGPGAEASSPAGSFPMFGCWVVVGSGSLPLPLVYVDDVVDGLIQAALRPSLEGTVINLVDGTRITQREYIRASRFARPNVKVVYVPKVVMMMAAVAIEALGRILKRNVPLSRYRIQSLRPLSNIDQTAAKARLGWVPRVGAIEGMRRAFLAN